MYTLKKNNSILRQENRTIYTCTLRNGAQRWQFAHYGIEC